MSISQDWLIHNITHSQPNTHSLSTHGWIIHTLTHKASSSDTHGWSLYTLTHIHTMSDVYNCFKQYTSKNLIAIRQNEHIFK